MDRYQAIYRRRSVRNYSHEELTKSEMKQIKRSIKNRIELYSNIDTEVDILGIDVLENAIKGIVLNYNKIEAPYYLVVGSETKEGYLRNIGYSIEPLVLDLTRTNLGGCWMGAGFDVDEVKRAAGFTEDMKPVVLIAFGYPADGSSPHRNNREEAKRKGLSELLIHQRGEINGTWRNILDAARMAPSAVNSQPWRFDLQDDTLHVFKSDDLGILKNALRKFGPLDELNYVDMGIALSHIKIAFEHLSKECRFRRYDVQYRDHEYIISVEGG